MKNPISAIERIPEKNEAFEKEYDEIIALTGAPYLFAAPLLSAFADAVGATEILRSPENAEKPVGAVFDRRGKRVLVFDAGFRQMPLPFCRTFDLGFLFPYSRFRENYAHLCALNAEYEKITRTGDLYARHATGLERLRQKVLATAVDYDKLKTNITRLCRRYPAARENGRQEPDVKVLDDPHRLSAIFFSEFRQISPCALVSVDPITDFPHALYFPERALWLLTKGDGKAYRTDRFLNTEAYRAVRSRLRLLTKCRDGIKKEASGIRSDALTLLYRICSVYEKTADRDAYEKLLANPLTITT